MLRIFGLSLATTVAALVAAFLYGGASALALCLILGIFEVSFSFDNAVVNAVILERLDARWQRLFLTIGVPIATFGMRFTLPLVVVWATAGLTPGQTWRLAMHPPAHKAAYFPDGTPSYATHLHHAHPLIIAFGGTFLMMLFLVWVFEERETRWLAWLERPLARAGRLDMLAVALTLGALVSGALVAVSNGHLSADRLATVLMSGLAGMAAFIIVSGLGEAFNVDEDEVAASALKLVGRAALFTFLYLEVLDASMSFDGVIGAFAITSDPIIIALGLGLIGSMFVRSLTIYLVRGQQLAKYAYLEHGAHWAIGALSMIMLVSLAVEVDDLITGLTGVVLIGAAFLTSIVRRRRERATEAEWDAALIERYGKNSEELADEAEAGYRLTLQPERERDPARD